jgi:hypothetical protein
MGVDRHRDMTLLSFTRLMTSHADCCAVKRRGYRPGFPEGQRQVRDALDGPMQTFPCVGRCFPENSESFS